MCVCVCTVCLFMLGNLHLCSLLFVLFVCLFILQDLQL